MTMFTGNGIVLYRWASIRVAIQLEMKGFKLRHFAAAKSEILMELGLPPKTRLPKMLEAVEKKIKEVEATIKPGDIT